MLYRLHQARALKREFASSGTKESYLDNYKYMHRFVGGCEGVYVQHAGDHALVLFAPGHLVQGSGEGYLFFILVFCCA